MPRKAKSTHDVCVHGPVYAMVRDYCRKRGVPIGAEVSTWIDDYFDQLEATPAQVPPPEPEPELEPEPEPEPEPLEPEPEARELRRSDAEVEAEAKEHFTF